MRNVVLAAALTLAAAVPAQAQVQWEDRGFVNLSGLAQAASRDVAITGSFELYDEESTFDGRREISSGGLFDVSAGVRVWRNLAAGIGFSRFANSANPEIVALVPDVLLFDSPHQQVVSAGELNHSEKAVHLSAVWFWPVTEKVDFALSAGPSVFNVSQDTVTITDANVEPGTSTLTGVTRAAISETSVGFNVGIDVTYLLTPRIGAGLLLRYAGAEPEVGGTTFDVGGFQVGAGLRMRF